MDFKEKVTIAASGVSAATLHHVFLELAKREEVAKAIIKSDVSISSKTAELLMDKYKDNIIQLLGL